MPMDEDAVAALYREHGAALRRFARGAVGSSKAEDIVQEAIIRVWRQAPPDTQSLRAYLYRTVRNLIVDQHRLAARRPRSAASIDEMPDGFAVAVDVERIDELLDRVVMEEALARLTPEHRQALVAVHYRRLSVAEAAQELGVPAGTVKSRCFYALKSLRSALDEMGVDR
ncbi:sigma-70 family RNA polymerase sigma factor [Sinomonas sp. ASV486]|uniref:Sigma-70 family RNA polymerase sigma factor n=1 Tax=Sinomonas puerhi TaxID=3238584 RepID=A0AB39L1B0_9MICC|nr:sigma-70 family RNA polymerase sigma factor [Sinomonas sp. ASV486]MDQ4488961.1 sigma-70 family RNA polymerase sigma factor [Sinomonas sp. ASV486]